MEPVKRAIGTHNFEDTSPAKLLGQFQHYTKAVILRINEGRDRGETDRFKFYDHIKTLIVAPPDMLPTNEKFLREYYVANVRQFRRCRRSMASCPNGSPSRRSRSARNCPSGASS
jgi:hypothetical protein